MNFILWVSLVYPFLVFGALNLKREVCPLEGSLFSKQQWGPLDCIGFLILMYLSLSVLKTASEYLSMSPGGIIGILEDLFPLVILAIYIRYKSKQTFSNLGLQTSCLSTDILYGLKGILPWTLISTILGFWISVDFDPSEAAIKSEEVVQGLQEVHIGSQSITFLMVLISSVLLGPIREEVMYRGFFYGPIRRRVSRKAAILISSSIFTSIHVSNANLFPVGIFLLGCLFAYQYEKSGSLIPSIVGHSFWNLIVSLRDSYRHNFLPFVLSGYPESFLSVLLIIQAMLFLIVYWKYRGMRTEGSKK